MDLTPHRDLRRHLTRTDPDPRVRHRADGLLLVAGGLSLTQAALRLGCARTSLRTWATRFLAEGRDGLADRARRGRPPKLDAAARELLDTALAQSPLDHDYPVTVYRILAAMGYRYRRPRHDLTHRQDVEAVTSAKHVLAELQKRGRLPGLDSAWSTWMNVTSIPIPTWRRSGSDAAAR